MRNFVQKGERLTFVESAITHPTHSDGLVNSGDPCLVGRIAGVANNDAAETTDDVVLDLEGVFDLEVVGSGNGISVGETVFMDPSSGVLGPDLTDTPFGVALEAIAAGVTATIPVRLFGATPGATGYFS